jgi:hypothetical protein
MPLEMKLWQVDGTKLRDLNTAAIDYERRLEEWICEDPSILGLDMIVLGSQINTGFGRIDVLGITREGELVIIEVKRDRTPRDVVAQTLDYASWINALPYEEFERIALQHRKKTLGELFKQSFDSILPPEISGGNHRMLIVSAELDSSSERIVRYLAEKHGLNINAVFFKFFRNAGSEFLGRAWLIDPEELQERAEIRHRRPWSGFWFVNVGEGEHRNWDDYRKYGYISAGQGEKYSKPLNKLAPGDKIFAYMRGIGYVGFGEVVSRAVPISEFAPPNEDQPLLNLPLLAPKASENADDPVNSEWAVGVRWLRVFDRGDARRLPGMFANQNIVCKLTDQSTLTFVMQEFGAVLGEQPTSA